MNNELRFLDIKYIVVGGLSIWAAFFLIWINKAVPDLNEGSILAKIEFIVQVVTLLILNKQHKIYKKNQNNKSNYLFLLWFVINWWLLWVDILFYIAAYLSNSYLQELSNLSFILYYAPCIIYAIMTIIFLSIILVKKILVNKAAKKNLLLLLGISLIVFKLYLSSINYAYPILSFNNILQIILLFTEFILFDICIIGMIYATTLNAFLFLIGLIALVIGDFFLTYTYMSQTVAKYFIIGEFLWCLGLLFLLFSAIAISNSKSQLIPDYFRNDNAIKSRIGFNIYIISIISFIIIYYASYYLQLINQKFLVVFPILTMLYSVMVVIFSIVIGNKFEEPFQELHKNIEVMLSNKTNYALNYKFDIEEFDFLQKFLMQSVKLKEQSNQLYIAFGAISASAAHSLGSPLASLRGAIHNIKNSVNLDANLHNLEESAVSIEEIADKMRKQYRNITSPIIDSKNVIDENEDKPRYINLIKLIKGLISLKYNEWQKNPCKIDFIIDVVYPYFYLSPGKIKIILSDLLNNSYESLSSTKDNISIRLSQDNSFLFLTIKDSGIGVAPESIPMVLKGKSFKHEGRGLGLSSANNYIKSIDGYIAINSTLGEGTEINISIPITNHPKYFTKEIPYSTNSSFIIIDDEPTIHVMIQDILRDLQIKSYHFTDVNEYFNFINKFNDINQLIFLIDLNLNNENWDGFKIIKSLNNIKSSSIYLMTSEAEKLQVQEYVKINKIGLLPKDILLNLIKA